VNDNLPHLITREQAAWLCSLTPSGFSGWVAKGKMPKMLPGTRRWSRRAVELALEAISGVKPESSVVSVDTEDEADRWFRESGYESAA
jgi:hypothetical protein